eukprot:1160070-Pelagomonas_calceolata.AAC.8
MPHPCPDTHPACFWTRSACPPLAWTGGSCGFDLCNVRDVERRHDQGELETYLKSQYLVLVS